MDERLAIHRRLLYPHLWSAKSIDYNGKELDVRSIVMDEKDQLKKNYLSGQRRATNRRPSQRLLSNWPSQNDYWLS